MRDHLPIIEHEHKPNCFVLTSFTLSDEPYMGKLAKPTVSFLYRGENVAAEWEVSYGPIQMWRRADGESENTKEHYAYPFVKTGFADWSQMAVDREGLKPALRRGDWDTIFSVLKRWADNNQEEFEL